MSSSADPNVMAKMEAWAVCKTLKETIERLDGPKRDWKAVDNFESTIREGNIHDALRYREEFERVLVRYAPHVPGGF